jgi:hypothetical protein
VKYQAVGQEHRLQLLLRFAQHLVRDLRSLLQFAHGVRFGLEDRQLLLDGGGAIRAANVADDLPAATPKPKFVIGSRAAPFGADESLVRQRLEVVGRQPE